MNKYLREAPESDLVITKLGKVEDYLPVYAPLLDYLVMVSLLLKRYSYSMNG